jgi:pimeloyl-ACP methyl ester carboxylesterase
VDETGDADSQSVLFVHGFSASRVVWEYQLHSHLAEDFQLVAVDMRGHGRSEKPKDGYTASELWAADIQAVIDELRLEDPVLVGWSAGNSWIADYLSVEGEDEISGVNMVGPVVGLRDEQPADVIGPKMLELFDRGVFTTTDAEESSTGLDEFVSLWTAEPLPTREHLFLLGAVSLVPPYARAGMLARAGTVAFDELLTELDSPVLITHGERDEIVPPKATTTLAEMIPHSQVSFYPGVGHMPFLEETDRFNRELREFVVEL